MVALLHPTPVPTRSRLRDHSGRSHDSGAASATLPSRPDLRLLRGGLDTPTADRSGLLVGLAVVAVLAALVGLRLAQGSPPQGPVPLPAASAAPAEPLLGETTRVVQAGDTLWAIAETLAPGQDPRPIVDALADRNGGSALRVGDVMVVPAGLSPGAVASNLEADTLAAVEPSPILETVGAE